MRRVTVSHPFGNPNSYNAALAFHEAGLLSSFHTCLFRPFGVRRRYHPGLVGAAFQTHPRAEILRLALGSFGRSPRMVDHTGRLFDQAVAAGLSTEDGAIYAYEDWACNSFLRARDLGLSTYYELPTAYFGETRRLLDQEIRREPGLKPYLQALNEPDAKLERKRRELAMADIVICPSTFVRRSLDGRLSNRSISHVIPYGSDTTVSPKTWSDEDLHRPLRLIYAGALSPQKGLHDLFQALESLSFYSYLLTLAGRWVSGYKDWLSRRYRVHYEYVGQLQSSELYRMYRTNHVLVLPSLCDGFGLVMLEAMASGIPVIATERTGAPDIITHGQEGYLVRAGHPEDLVKVLVRCLDDPEALAEIGRSARRKAEELTWTTYRRRLVSAVCGHAPETTRPMIAGHAFDT